MKGYVAFLKKEWLEQLRTYRLFILLILFFIFGMMSPLTAKLTPLILKNFAVEGMQITMQDPTAMDSYMQFFKNNTSMGLIVLILVFSGILSSELSKGTLINILTKGLSRNAVIMAKFTSAAIIWTVCLALCFVTTYGYTEYLFDQQGISHLWFAVLCLWLFGIFLLTLLLLVSTVGKSSYTSLLGVGAVVVILFMVNMLPVLQKYNPLLLISNNVGMLASEYQISDAIASVGVTAVLSFIFLAGAVLIFRKKRI